MKPRLVVALFTAALLALPSLWGQGAGGAAGPTSPPAEKKAPARKPATFPFRGTLKAVDRDAMTLTLAGKEKDRVIHITSQTRFTKDGKPAVLGDGVPGEEVAGSARKEADGRTVAVSVRFGPAPGKAPKAGKGAKTPEKETRPATP